MLVYKTPTMTRTITIVDHPHGFYVDYIGRIQSTENPRVGTYHVFEKSTGCFVDVVVLECNIADDEILGEYAWYASIDEIQTLLKG